jgi:hypothetical protein
MNFGLLDEEIGTNEDKLHQLLLKLVQSVICMPLVSASRLGTLALSSSTLPCMQTDTSYISICYSISSSCFQ